MCILLSGVNVHVFQCEECVTRRVSRLKQSLLPNADMSWTSDIAPLLEYYTERTPGAVIEVGYPIAFVLWVAGLAITVLLE